MVLPIDQYAALSDAFATARPEETCACVVDNCRCVAVSDDRADIAEVLVRMLVIASAPPRPENATDGGNGGLMLSNRCEANFEDP